MKDYFGYQGETPPYIDPYWTAFCPTPTPESRELENKFFRAGANSVLVAQAKRPALSNTFIGEEGLFTEKLHIDIETFSTVNLKTEGLYKYAVNCEILLFAYSFDNEPTQCIDLTWDEIPERVIKALTDPKVLKIAHNAAFERAVISRCLKIHLPVTQWWCSMAKCAIAGLPLSLDDATRILKLTTQKDPVGKALIKLFCVPCKPSKANGFRIRNLPEHYLEKWNQFIGYCIGDVNAEKGLTAALSFIKVPKKEKSIWELDQIINEVGVKVDTDLVRNAIRMDELFKDRLMFEAVQITGLDNGNSVKQLKEWLEEETDSVVTSLAKDEIPKLIEKFSSIKVKAILTIRQKLSKTSVKKYKTMLLTAGIDKRIRGLFQYYGAMRTGRWAGRGVQVQNLTKTELAKDKELAESILDIARELLLKDDVETLEVLFESLSTTLSMLIRTAFVPEKGNRFIVSDFSAIEARVIAWLANEKWRLDVFATHGKIYEASASQMFHVPIEEITKGSPLRQKGKVAELACGYGGGVDALIRMKALEEGLTEEELPGIISAWRTANQGVVKLWKTLNNAAITAIRTGTKVPATRGVYFEYRNKWLLMYLPSGRAVSYPFAGLEPGKYGDQVIYYGLAQTGKKWVKLRMYGGKFAENLCQAIARDCMAQALLNLYEAGYQTVMHVHDESVNECKEGFGSLEEVNALMIKPEPWMRDLPLKAEGFESYYYKKD